MSRLVVVLLVLITCSLGIYWLPAHSQQLDKGAPAKPVLTAPPSRETMALASLLGQTVDTKGLNEKVKLKTALEYLSGKVGGKLPILVDREAWEAALGADAPDPYEE